MQEQTIVKQSRELGQVGKELDQLRPQYQQMHPQMRNRDEKNYNEEARELQKKLKDKEQAKFDKIQNVKEQFGEAEQEDAIDAQLKKELKLAKQPREVCSKISTGVYMIKDKVTQVTMDQKSKIIKVTYRKMNEQVVHANEEASIETVTESLQGFLKQVT